MLRLHGPNDHHFVQLDNIPILSYLFFLLLPECFEVLMKKNDEYPLNGNSNMQDL